MLISVEVKGVGTSLVNYQNARWIYPTDGGNETVIRFSESHAVTVAEPFDQVVLKINEAMKWLKNK